MTSNGMLADFKVEISSTISGAALEELRIRFAEMTDDVVAGTASHFNADTAEKFDAAFNAAMLSADQSDIGATEHNGTTELRHDFMVETGGSIAVTTLKITSTAPINRPVMAGIVDSISTEVEAHTKWHLENLDVIELHEISMDEAEELAATGLPLDVLVEVQVVTASSFAEAMDLATGRQPFPPAT